MIKETMTREQRMMTAVTLNGIPDRVPVSSMFDEFAMRQKGLQMARPGDSSFMAKRLQAIRDTFDDLGGYDYLWHPGTMFPYATWRGSCDMRVSAMGPGRTGPEATLEKETITFEDYDAIIDKGWNGFCEEFYPRMTGQSLEQIEENQKRQLKVYLENVAWWRERGVPVNTGGMVVNCEMILSLGRTLTKLTLDIRRHPDKVQAVLEAMVGDLIQNALDTVKAIGIPWVTILLARGSSTYYNLPTFERFVFPFLKKKIDAFTSAGIYVNMHMDTNWIKNIPYFKEFPQGMCIAELDGTTDIFKTKEMLGGHMCIKGDVPAPLLTLGKPEEVTEYCCKLIDVVGKGGGFILGAGCCCPVDAKFENVKAMVDAAKNYYPHRIDAG